MTDDRARILVVDDEPKLVRLVREVLTATGFEVLTASRGERAIDMVAMEAPDLLLLDLVLADSVDGYAVARRVREFSEIPIIILTAKARESDMLKGFEVGADDFLVKPFSSKELLARIRAVLKRARQDTQAVDGEIHCGALRIDLARHRVSLRGEDIRLTRTEFSLLRELATHRNQVLLHGQLLAAVWGPEFRDDLEYLRAYVHYLRKKLEEHPSHPVYILTVPGVGYMLECPGAEG